MTTYHHPRQRPIGGNFFKDLEKNVWRRPRDQVVAEWKRGWNHGQGNTFTRYTFGHPNTFTSVVDYVADGFRKCKLYHESDPRHCPDVDLGALAESFNADYLEALENQEQPQGERFNPIAALKGAVTSPIVLIAGAGVAALVLFKVSSKKKSKRRAKR